MKRSLIHAILCGVLLATGWRATFAAEEQPAVTKPRLTREEAVLVTITASVEAIDQSTREVTLKGALGNSVTFTVDQRVKRLKEFKVGDLIRADYYVSIAQNLGDRGVTQVAAVGDVTVGYLVIIGNNVTTELVADYFGYGEVAAGLHDKAHAAYTSGKNPNYFEAGTLVIDITDTQSHKLLKRGYATRPTLKNLPDEAKAAHIQEVVDEILRDVRIAP